MGIMSIFGAWASGDLKAKRCVESDAAALMRIWGEEALDVAANLSWREDCGLMQSSRPGHWGRVQLEIARRQGTGQDGRSCEWRPSAADREPEGHSPARSRQIVLSDDRPSSAS